VITHMMLDSGETAVIGGLLTEADSKTTNAIPLLGDIPIIGYLFKNDRIGKVKDNLIILVTPHILRGAEERRSALSSEMRRHAERIRDRTDTVAPRLDVSEFVPIGQMVIINGETEPDARLWIDNNKVDVFEDGSFNAVVKLRREGVNELLIVAQDPAGNETSVTRQAYVETF